MANIVQAEFFLVDLETDSLNKLLSECAERTAQSSRIKLCVRFYDECEEMLSLANEAGRLGEQEEKTLATFLASQGLMRWWLDRRHRRLVGNMLRLKAKALAASVDRLQRLTHKGASLAIEDRKHRYRWVRPDEVHELCEQAHRATAVWLSITPGEHLLSNKNTKLLALLM